jgi:hypothetical protein
MIKTPIYLAYGALVLALGGYLQAVGTPFRSATEVQNVPKSVRENPGVYRSHYGYLPRIFGGK